MSIKVSGVRLWVGASESGLESPRVVNNGNASADPVAVVGLLFVLDLTVF